MDAALNWLAQGGVVAIVAAGVLRLIPRVHAQARYAFLWMASIVVITLPVWPDLSENASAIAVTGTASSALDPVVSLPIAWWTSSAMAAVCGAIWCTVSALRIAVSVRAVRAARRRCLPFPSEVETRLQHWSRMKMAGRPVRLALVSDVRSAAVLGCGSPVIAVTPGLVDELTDADLDRVLIHEWAHVQRRDDIAQFAQMWVRVLAGWHPAIAWLQRRLDFEREVACDQMAVAVTGSAKSYAACLVHLAERPGHAMQTWPALAAAAPSGLRRRLVRILADQRASHARPWRATATSAGTCLSMLALVIGQMRVAELAAAAPIAFESALPAVARSMAADISSFAMSASQAPSVLQNSDAGPGKPQRDRRRDDLVDSHAPQVISPSARSLAVPTTTEQSANLPSVEPPSLGVLTAGVLDRLSPQPEPVQPRGGTKPPLTSQDAPVQVAAADQRTPWAAASNGGVAIGRGAQNAGLATAGFFTRFGKKVAGSF